MNFLHKLMESIDQHQFIVEKIIPSFPCCEVIDKTVSLYQFNDQKIPIKVNEEYFRKYGLHAYDFRFLEYVVCNHDMQQFIYIGSWKWAKKRRDKGKYDHIRLFTTHSNSLGQVAFTGYDDSLSRHFTYQGECSNDDHTYIQRSSSNSESDRIGFWFDSYSIQCGMLCAYINPVTPDIKIHMQYDCGYKEDAVLDPQGLVKEKRTEYYLQSDGELNGQISFCSTGVRCLGRTFKSNELQ